MPSHGYFLAWLWLYSLRTINNNKQLCCVCMCVCVCVCVMGERIVWHIYHRALDVKRNPTSYNQWLIPCNDIKGETWMLAVQQRMPVLVSLFLVSPFLLLHPCSQVTFLFPSFFSLTLFLSPLSVCMLAFFVMSSRTVWARLRVSALVSPVFSPLAQAKSLLCCIRLAMR